MLPRDTAKVQCVHCHRALLPSSIAKHQTSTTCFLHTRRLRVRQIAEATPPRAADSVLDQTDNMLLPLRRVMSSAKAPVASWPGRYVTFSRGDSTSPTWEYPAWVVLLLESHVFIRAEERGSQIVAVREAGEGAYAVTLGEVIAHCCTSESVLAELQRQLPKRPPGPPGYAGPPGPADSARRLASHVRDVVERVHQQIASTPLCRDVPHVVVEGVTPKIIACPICDGQFTKVGAYRRHRGSVVCYTRAAKRKYIETLTRAVALDTMTQRQRLESKFGTTTSSSHYGVVPVVCAALTTLGVPHTEWPIALELRQTQDDMWTFTGIRCPVWFVELARIIPNSIQSDEYHAARVVLPGLGAVIMRAAQSARARDNLLMTLALLPEADVDVIVAACLADLTID